LQLRADVYHPSLVAFSDACLNNAVCSANNSSRDAVFAAAFRDAIRFFFCNKNSHSQTKTAMILKKVALPMTAYL
jgi:hypothetical protein